MPQKDKIKSSSVISHSLSALSCVSVTQIAVRLLLFQGTFGHLLCSIIQRTEKRRSLSKLPSLIEVTRSHLGADKHFFPRALFILGLKERIAIFSPQAN